MPAIETDGLSKSFGDVTALEDLTIAVPSGCVYGFLGPNGAGKTTTMRLLTGLVAPTDGTATVCGEPITDREAVTEHIGYLPEEPPLRDYLTGREQLEYAASLRRLPAAEADDRLDELLDRFDLAGDANRRISEYSKGMRQKLGLIQAILHDPAVVFLDEPTSGLDPESARRMKETIAGLADRETTVFLSSHVLPVVDELADTVGVLYDGTLLAEDEPDALKRTARGGSLEDAFIQLTTDEAATPSAER